MRFTTDDLPEINEVSTDQIERIFSEDAFGKFAVLAASDDVFMQTACAWEPGEESKRFIDDTGSDPFRLEYRDGETGRMFAAERNLTLAEVSRAFIEYLNGQMDWLDRFGWREVDYS